MKKFLTLALAIVMVLTLSVNVFAEAGSATVGVSENSIPNNNTQIPVKVKVDETAATPTYKIDLSWESMSFTYVVTNSYNVTDHVNTRTGEWSDTDADITVTNHSNDSVTVNATIEVVTNTTGITATFNGGATTATETLISAEGSGNTPPSTKFTVYINGAEPAVSTETIISNVKVVIS